jgi:hypothetical protein
VPAGRSIEKNRFGPRLGFAYTLNERTVIRGGTGKYFADVSDQVSSWTERYGGGEINAQVAYDGRPDFAGNPWNSRPQPTYEEALRIPGLRKSVSQIATPNLRFPYAYESSIGVQRQLSTTMALQVDYVVNNSRRELFQRNINLTYNPVTGVNYVSTDASRAVYADWGVVNAYLSEGWSNFHALEIAFTKRLSRRWQASGTYTLSVYRDGTTSPAPSINLVQDLGEEYGLATTDQRHRAVFNGIWDVGYGFQLSGLYFYGSGQRFATTYGGGDRPRLRPDGSIVPRNNFVGLPLHRVDFRLLRRFGLGGRRSIDGIVEAYNLFNHENFGNYEVRESNANYGKPIPLLSLVYQPRMLQLGFRATF